MFREIMKYFLLFGAIILILLSGCPEAPTCGNEICELGENAENCPADCHLEVKTCSDLGGNICYAGEICPGEEIGENQTLTCCSVLCEPEPVVPSIEHECKEDWDCDDNNPNTTDLCKGYPKKCSNELNSCDELGGYICSDSGVCKGNIIESSDSDICCDIACEHYLCENVSCPIDEKCVAGECVLKTCEELGGEKCDSPKACPGDSIQSSNEYLCCEIGKCRDLVMSDCGSKGGEFCLPPNECTSPLISSTDIMNCCPIGDCLSPGPESPNTCGNIDSLCPSGCDAVADTDCRTPETTLLKINQSLEDLDGWYNYAGLRLKIKLIDVQLSSNNIDHEATLELYHTNASGETLLDVRTVLEGINLTEQFADAQGDEILLDVVNVREINIGETSNVKYVELDQNPRNDGIDRYCLCGGDLQLIKDLEDEKGNDYILKISGIFGPILPGDQGSMSFELYKNDEYYDNCGVNFKNATEIDCTFYPAPFNILDPKLVINDFNVDATHPTGYVEIIRESRECTSNDKFCSIECNYLIDNDCARIKVSSKEDWKVFAINETISNIGSSYPPRVYYDGVLAGVQEVDGNGTYSAILELREKDGTLIDVQNLLVGQETRFVDDNLDDVLDNPISVTSVIVQ